MITIKKNGKKEFTAYSDGKKVGYLTFCYPNDISKQRNINIEYVHVLPSFRRQGIATALLKYFIKTYSNKVTWISFWTGKDMEENHGLKLYLKLGFKEKAYQEDYYTKGIGTRLYVKRCLK